MTYIDKYAYLNRLRNVHPMEKFLFAMTSLAIVMVSGSNLVHTMAFLIMSGVVLFAARIPVSVYLKLLLLPIFFLGAGVFSLIVQINFSAATFSLTPGGMDQAWNLFLKAMASVSCLYFLVLTIPVTEIIHILRRFKIPVLFLELLVIVYKFIFILFDTLNRIYVSQNSRLGYKNYKTTFASLGKLGGSLLILSLKRYQDMYNALESRCFTGDFHFQNPKHSFSLLSIGYIVFCDSALIITEVVTRSAT